MTEKDLFLRSVQLDWSKIPENSYLREIPALQDLSEIMFHQPVTFFVGENGTGKSTLLEAIALNLGFNAEGGTKNYRFSTYDSHSDLYQAMRLMRADGVHPSLRFHEKSHGESFLALVQNYFKGNGVYLMDEPEAAFSPQRQLTLLAEIHKNAAQGAQFIIVSHSPILLGMPDSEILTFDDGPVHPCEYEETSSYAVTLGFMTHRKQMLRELLSDSELAENTDSI